MLVGKSLSVRGRVTLVLAALAGVTAAGVGAAAAGAAAGLWAWPPRPSSPAGVGLGLAAGAVVLFEMALAPRKWFRGRRLGPTRAWMRWHVWLGMACLPVVLLHAGFAAGGPLTSVLLALFLVVTASGVWGLLMQQWLPEKLLAEVPGETVASEVDRVGAHHAAEAARLVDELVAAHPAAELVAFRDAVLVPYLTAGGRSPLASPAEAETRFARLRDAVPEAAAPAVERLRQLAGLRREWDRQARLHALLHNWLLVHLPLAVALTGVMFVHAARALKYW